MPGARGLGQLGRTPPSLATAPLVCTRVRQGEREAVERAAAEASRAVAGQAVEEELERLHAELVATKVRWRG